MYWINIKDGEFLFTARKHYAKLKSSDNIVRLSLSEDNENEILNSIDDIYKSLIAVTNMTTPLKSQCVPDDSVSYMDSVRPSLDNLQSETDIREKELGAALTLLSENIKDCGDNSIAIGNIPDTRVRNLFAIKRIAGYGDILRYTAPEIRAWKNCGRKCLEYITNMIYGFLNSNGIDAKPIYPASASVVVDELRLQRIMAGSVFRDCDLSSSEMEIFAHAAVKTKQLFEQAVNALNNDYSNQQHWSILTEYIYNDGATLQSVGDRYGITRERVRQIVKKYTVRIKSGLRKKSSIAELSSQIVQTFDAIDDGLFIQFIAYGLLVNFSKRFAEIILSSFYSDGKRAVGVAGSLLNDKRITSQQKTKKVQNDNKEVELLAKACYPSCKDSNIDIEKIASAQEDLQFRYKQSATDKILRFKTIKRVVVNPDLVYSQSSKTNHVPDFLLETADGKIVLVVVVAVINMAFGYNIKRFNDLHTYCKENGFGYLVMNDRFTTIFEVKQTELDKNLVKELNYFLEKTGSIVWKDIILLRDQFTITNDIIAAYVLQNKLDFQLKPFRIKKRGG
ncbi:MAG: hypothetical protein K2J01_06630 [Clostridiales bacterium]|nr:hypothetical protein [Clostridiales bacterium]